MLKSSFNKGRGFRYVHLVEKCPIIYSSYLSCTIDSCLWFKNLETLKAHFKVFKLKTNESMKVLSENLKYIYFIMILIYSYYILH